jgi:hypothetical protein
MALKVLKESRPVGWEVMRLKISERKREAVVDAYQR